MSTPRFDLDTYQQGDDNWSHTDTVEFVDEYGIDKGPITERPESGTYDDEFYFATDQELLYRNHPENGWVVAGFGTENDPIPIAYFEDADVDGELKSEFTESIVQIHSTDLENEYSIPEGSATVVAGPLTGEQRITGEGKLKVI